MKKTLIIPVGLPRCGKSTWSKNQLWDGSVVVNPDSIRLAIHGHDYIASAEPLVWATAKIMVNALFTAGHNKVILDATSIKKIDRKGWVRPNDWKTIFVVFPVNKELFISRAINDGREYLVPIIEKMVLEYEPVEPEEGGIITYISNEEGN